MANPQNLKPQAHVLTVEEASKGGKASSESRKEKRLFREALLFLLDQPSREDEKQTNREAITSGLVRRAISGDVKAFEVIRDTIGEKPANEITLKKTDFSALDGAFGRLIGSNMKD